MTVTAETAVTAGRNVPLDPGDSVGVEDASRWRAVRHIADGGFSSVYEVAPATPATRLRHGPATRALKCLWGTPAELTAIGGEAAKMAAVEGHPNVLGLVTSFRFGLAAQPHDHYVGLVLELAAEDLPRFAARVTPSERAWAAVFEQVAAGLEHIHARRVVHGDIKPTNVLRVDGRFAVADFGVSAPLESTRSAGIGLARTVAFWPPESASQGVLGPDGVRLPPAEGWRASQQGDVWALAVSMHRLLTGRHITPGTTPEQQYELLCLGKYSIDDGLGPGWRRLLADCLVHDPAQRVVSTAAELRARLADLALADQYAGVPWPDGQPRVVAILDLGRPHPNGHPPDPGTAVLAGPEPATRQAEEPAGGQPIAEGLAAPAPAAPAPAEPAPAEPAAPTPAASAEPAGPAVPPEPEPAGSAEPAGRDASPEPEPAAPAPNGSAQPAPAEPGDAEPRPAQAAPVPGGDDHPGLAPAASAATVEVLVLYLTREGGRVHGAVLPGSGLLLAATRHLTDIAVPGLAQQVRDSQRAMIRLVEEQERKPATARRPAAEWDGASTNIVDPNDLELTGELSVAVAGMTRQRDELARDRDRLVRNRDELAAERDRLRQQYADLAHRLDRLEHDRERRDRSLVDSPTAVLRALGRSTAPQPRVPAAPVRATRPAAVQARRRRHPLAGTVLFLLVLLLVAAVLGVVAVGLATHRDPVTVLDELVQAVLNRTR